MEYTALVIDDSEIMRLILSRSLKMLHRKPARIFFGNNGEEALNLLKQEPVDVIFCDLNMPVMDGWGFLKKKNEHPLFKDIPIIVVSTEGAETRINELFDFGVKGFVRKPFHPEDLDSLLQTVLEE
jgi:two-component system, chemotaxis family, chemotaxis protein CheY